ncbi:DUF6668 family protein [Propionicicella superfundia]|uniref:DUF6668 family protein n=1 Tax=Propionicicella superfundia TaxID=348582 RepID=UPI0012EBA3E1|nr:DUF6668 family protein [Propionicicella superfundia]
MISPRLAPQAGVSAPAEGLPLRPCAPGPALWVVGAHGGAGESSVAALDPAWAEAGHAWPAGHGMRACVLVARTHASGLLAAQRALTQWAAWRGPEVPALVALMLVADAPGKLPKPLRDLAAHVSGGAPLRVDLPWIDEWRFGPQPSVPPAAARVAATLASLTPAGETPR